MHRHKNITKRRCKPITFYLLKCPFENCVYQIQTYTKLIRHLVSSHPKQKILSCIMEDCDYINNSWNAPNTIKHIRRCHHDKIMQDKIRQCYQPALNELVRVTTEISPEEDIVSGDDVIPVIDSLGCDEEEIRDEQIDDIEGNLL